MCRSNFILGRIHGKGEEGQEAGSGEEVKGKNNGFKRKFLLKE
jgi:hypothetical protein